MSDEPMCECGHDLYSHYMCGIGAGRCLTRCGCKAFKRSFGKPKPIIKPTLPAEDFLDGWSNRPERVNP